MNAAFAFTSAQNKDEVNAALDLILKQLEEKPDSAADIDKAELVQAFMKHKKARPEEWTADVDAKFKSVIAKV